MRKKEHKKTIAIFPDGLLIIMVIYNRPLEACESFQAILGMCAENAELDLFVYDNSPISQGIGHYEGLTITYFHDAENSGVSKAYNVGVAHGGETKKNGYCYWIKIPDYPIRYWKIMNRP